MSRKNENSVAMIYAGLSVNIELVLSNEITVCQHKHILSGRYITEGK